MKQLRFHLLALLIAVVSCTKSSLDISGSIRCMEDPTNVTIRLSGEETHELVADDDGSFMFHDVDGGTYAMEAEKELDNGAFVHYSRSTNLEGRANRNLGGQLLQEIWMDDPLILDEPSYFNNGSDRAYLVWQQPDCNSWGEFEILIGNQPDLTRENANETIRQWRNDFEIAVPSTPVYFRVYSDNGQTLYGTNIVRISTQDIP